MSEIFDEKIPRSVFDTRDLAPKKALAAWHENIDVMFDARVADPDDPLFYSRIDAFIFGDVMLVDGHTGTQSYERSHKRIARDGVDHYLLQFYLTGSVARRDGQQQTKPGDLWITDLAQPLSSAAATADTINFFVPRRLLAPLLNAPDEHSMAIIDGRRPLVRLLRNHLRGLLTEAPSMTLGEGQAVIAPTLELAASAINGAAREDAVPSVEAALCDEICRHVRATPYHASVTRGTVAKRFGVSLRKLDYLFEPLGGFAHWIRGERLAQARMTLTNHVQLHMTIDEIATAYGFAHTTNFVRAFRNQYGMTPGQLRSLARERPVRRELKGHAATASWQSWIRAL